MFGKPQIWVPGEESENGVVVFDLFDEAKNTLIPEKGGTMTLVSRTGRVNTVKAVKGEVRKVETDARDRRIAHVRFKTGATVRTLVLGDWHLAGLTEPGRSEAEAPEEVSA